MQYFVSDLHIGHRNLATRNGSRFTHGWRPFESVEEHDNTIINAIKSTVKDDDDLYILGDVSLNTKTQPSLERLYSILEKIPGRLHIVPGNHDQGLIHLSKRFPDFDHPITELVTILRDVEILDIKKPSESYRIVLSHYPILEWPSKHHGAWHLHGHVHDPTFRVGPRSLNVCLDTIYYLTGKWAPLSLDWINKYMAIGDEEEE